MREPIDQTQHLKTEKEDQVSHAAQNALANYIETQNIAYFKTLLETEAHPDKRKLLIELLAQEEAKRAARLER